MGATQMAGMQAAGMQAAGMEVAGVLLVLGVGAFDMAAAVATMPDATAAMSLAVDVLGDDLFGRFAVPSSGRDDQTHLHLCLGSKMRVSSTVLLSKFFGDGCSIACSGHRFGYTDMEFMRDRVHPRHAKKK